MYIHGYMSRCCISYQCFDDIHNKRVYEVSLCRASNSRPSMGTHLGSRRMLLQEPADYPRINFVIQGQGKNIKTMHLKKSNQSHTNLFGFSHV